MFETTTRIISFELERSVTSTNTEDVIKFFSEIAEGNATFDASASFEPPELTRETFPKLMGSYRKLVRKKDHASMLALSGLMLKRAPNNPATAQMHTQSLIENERYDEALALCNKFRKVLDDALVWKLMEKFNFSMVRHEMLSKKERWFE